jgi:endo-1,4-beta-xylanase
MNHLKTAFHAFQLKKLEIYLNLTFFLIVNTSYAQTFNKEAFLKDYSGDMIVTTQVRGERNKAVLRGTEAQKNSAFVLKNYNGIQPSVYPAWEGGFWPKKKPKTIDDFKINTEALNELVNWGVANDFHIMHHCLIFPNKYFPEWFSSSNYSEEELASILELFINEVITSNENASKVSVFNVINEIFEMGKSGNYRKSGTAKEDFKWMDLGFETDQSGLTGPDKINDKHPVFVGKVFEIASQLTDAKLEIRDFNIAFGGKKADGLYQLIKHLKHKGLRVDAVGFQCHLNVGIDYDYEKLRANILRFIELGVEVYITELDVGLNLWSKDGNHKKVTDLITSEAQWQDFFEAQNVIYYNLVKTAKISGVKLLSDWGFRDDIPYGGWRKNQKAWMVNKDYSRKGAYEAVLKALYDADQ